MRKLSLLLIVSVFVQMGCQHKGNQTQTQNCLERRGALDVGSGSTKAVAAVVNICEKRIESVILEAQATITFSEEVEKSADRKIPEEFLEEASRKLQNLVNQLKSHDLVSVSGVATSVFRTASNGSEALAFLSEKSGVPIKLISQSEEAGLGYLSARAVRPVKAGEELIVWDIGGGSMQITAHRGDQPVVYQGDLAAVNFKNRVLKELKKKDPRKIPSPNPLGKDWKKAFEMARQHARENPLRFDGVDGRKETWIGIGGVLSRSIPEQIASKSSVYTSQDLLKALELRASMTDAEVGGDFAATDVTNLALVAGYMEAFGIPRIESVSTSLVRGQLLAETGLKLRLMASTPAGGPLEISTWETDPKILQIRGPHQARLAKKALPSPLLLVTIGGTGSLPRDFGHLAEVASSRGFHVIGVDYPNAVITTVCRANPSPSCFDLFREEIMTGRDVSPHVQVDENNSLLKRIRKLVEFLARRDPKEWSVFWKGRDVDWSRVVAAGHSQGSGHAAFLSKKFPLKGVILLSGPQDISELGVAGWVGRPGATAGSRYHALVHKNDPFGSASQLSVIRALQASAPANRKDPKSLVIVSEKKENDPHNAVMFPRFQEEWIELLGLTAQ